MSASPLNEFIATIAQDGLMPTNRFSVEFALPATLRAAKSGYNWTGSLDTVWMLCEAASLPGMSISTQQARTYGEFREMPYERTFDNITLTFLVDTTMESKSLFDDWIHSIQDPITRQFNYYKEYITDLTIYVEDKDDKTRYQVKLYECYPKSVSPLTLDYNSKDVMKIQVSLNYRYWIAGSAIEDNENGLIVNGMEQLNNSGTQPGYGAYDDNVEQPNFNVENERLYPKF